MYTLTIYRIAHADGGWTETADHIAGAIARIEGTLLKRYQMECRINAGDTGSKAYRTATREK